MATCMFMDFLEYSWQDSFVIVNSTQKYLVLSKTGFPRTLIYVKNAYFFFFYTYKLFFCPTITYIETAEKRKKV